MISIIYTNELLCIINILRTLKKQFIEYNKYTNIISWHIYIGLLEFYKFRCYSFTKKIIS